MGDDSEHTGLVSAAELRAETFAHRDRPDLVLACQALRYAVYHHDLGLDTPDMDHARGLDIEENDPHCDFATVSRVSDGELLGCMRLQRGGAVRFYAELEFELTDPWWRDLACVEAARFAIRRPYRDGPVAMALFKCFRDYCRAHGVRNLLSVIIVPDPAPRLAFAHGMLRWLRPRIAFATERAHPQEGYVAPSLDMDGGGEVEDVEPTKLPPMLRMLATPRTTLCSPPAYCKRFHTWNFLFVTRL
jgi:hypothetical protein